MARIIQGDSKTVLKILEPNSIDSLVTDPPSSIGFMGCSWDSDKGGREQWIDWLHGIMLEAFLIMKPGAHGLVWALPRTAHWTTTALEDAGFECRDVCVHHFGSGFPKSFDISKGIDKKFGVEREVVGKNPNYRKLQTDPSAYNLSRNPYLSAPATPEAADWEGWGSALKPASEFWILIRKPLEKGFSLADNVLKWGTGGLNIDGCRIHHDEKLRKTVRTAPRYSGRTHNAGKIGGIQSDIASVNPTGRFPANLVLSHHPDCKKKKCVSDCPVKMLDDQSGITKSHASGYNWGASKQGDVPITRNIKSGIHFEDQGGASRFFKQFREEGSCQKKMLGGTSESLMVGGIGNGESQEIVGYIHNLNTVGFGNRNTGLFLPTAISITKTKTKQIMTFPIWNVGISLIIGNITIELERIIKPSKVKYIAAVNLVPNGKAWIVFRRGELKPIKGTVRSVKESALESGEKRIGSIITPTCENTAENIASRFFYCAKPSPKERGKFNQHPTVKAIKLCRYFCRLITPPGGTILDPFAGSGAIGCAAVLEGFDYIGIELDEDHSELASERLEEYKLKAKAERQKSYTKRLRKVII